MVLGNDGGGTRATVRDWDRCIRKYVDMRWLYSELQVLERAMRPRYVFQRS